MNTKRMLLMMGAVSVVALSSARLNATLGQPMVVLNPSGSVRIQQELPCRDTLDLTRKVIAGRIEVFPAQILSGRTVVKTFDLTTMQLLLDPFSVQRQCRGITATAQFQEIGVRLIRTLHLTYPGDGAEDLGGGKYRFTVAPDKFPLFESVRDNAPVKQPEQRYVKPVTNVVIVIDTAPPPPTGPSIATVVTPPSVSISFGLASLLKFKAGPINENRPGTLTGEVGGDVVPPDADQDDDGVPDLFDNCPAQPNPDQAPDKVAPVVSCTATRPPGGAFLVTATDACKGKVASIRLGGFPIDNGEVIKINEVGKKGDPVKLMPSEPKGVRFFQVGKGGAIIQATDFAGNVGSAACK